VAIVACYTPWRWHVRADTFWSSNFKIILYQTWSIRWWIKICCQKLHCCVLKVSSSTALSLSEIAAPHCEKFLLFQPQCFVRLIL
jgi:hypothetical protein